LRGLFTAQQPTEGGFDRRLRTADRRQRLVLFPASAKGLVQDHEFVGCGQLGSRVLVLQESFGIMVNYLSDIGTIESNHEAFVNDGTVMRSADVDALLAAEHISAPNSGQPESQEATGASAIESHELKFSK